ncbi:MerR family transcriptional regulator [Symbiobacterium thermophilum]|uniref:MerR family transcriptional regulator n=1 Tax=Symbiobacterium thermophilum TaxID=2734 RepID=A0A953LJS6_SYMTR|nr:MerR family transcriptional regulator [Symbiobacterium thermophilum]MBY6276217.1 MerR family transcriptional regulator [Symbiobacterium thermophilum]
MALTVKAVAELAGISVRTLHHYDEIGLLKPAGQSAAGYRLYSREDLERLQQILFFRELGFSLKEIAAILESPGFDRRQVLLAHREALLQRKARIERLIATVDRTLAAMEREDAPMDTREEMKELFDGFDPGEYEEEARQRWGGSREFRESAERTRKYTRQGWQRIAAEAGEIYGNIARLMDRDPGDPAVQEWVGRWHEHISKWYYDCSLEVFRGLGEMYVQDERFTRNIDKTKPGLARFLRDAMQIYCDRREGK